MKIFLDTAFVEEIREAADWGVLDGVTTNPSLMAKAGADYGDTVREICSIVSGPVSVEVGALDAKGMIDEGRSIAKAADNVVVKIPTTVEGLKAIRTLTSEDIKVNATLCFSSNQALLVAKAGATYVSPFIGRLDDAGQSGMDLIRELVTIFSNYGVTTEILAASIRHTQHVIEAAMAGADIATMPFGVLQKMIRHPLTDRGLETFTEDYRKVKAGKPQETTA
jgi:transaldolase